MRKLILVGGALVLGWLALSLLIAPPGTIQVPTPLPQPTITLEVPMGVDAFELNARIGRGVNLGNALEAPNEGDWGVVLQEEYFDLIKNAEFNSVRIPVRWSAHALEGAPFTIDPAFFDRVDWAVNHALQRGLVVILNVHHYEEIMQNPVEQADRFLGLWRQIAEHYRDYPDELLFEPLNEPNGALNSFQWNRLIARTIEVIRESNPVRTLVIGPVEWNSVFRLFELQLPAEDRHIIVTFHYYLPFKFTHQGAEWAQGADAWLGTTWEGTSADQKTVHSDFKLAAGWAEKENRPLLLGEFGAYNKADMASRARWTAFISRTAEEYGFSWTYWEFCSGFGVYDAGRRQWNQELLKALLPSVP